MRCVSYTRAASNRPSISGTKPESIMAQNQRIQDFAKIHGWKIEKKYSDRKRDADEETAFLEMKKDGMARKFDCVVIDSLYLCGKKTTLASDLFSLVFLPAGIHFAVVEDNIVSFEMDEKDAAEYLRNKATEYSRGRIAVSSLQMAERRKFQKYGYLFDDGTMELVVDEKVAGVVREIFKLATENYNAREIAEILDSKGVEPYHVYMKSLWGREFQHSYEDNRWNASEIARILCNRIYTGEWERSIGGEKVIVHCPSIIDRKLYEAVNGDNKPRRKIRKRASAGQMVFAKKVVDRDTGLYLYLHTRPCTGKQILKMKSPVPKTDYGKLWIAYEEVEGQVLLQMEKECAKARRAGVLIESDEARMEMEKRCRLFIEKAQAVFQKMMTLELCETVDAESEKELYVLDCELKELEGQITTIRKAFSRKNLWIKKFSSIDLNDGITRKTVTACIDRIVCGRFESVTVIFKEQEWYQLLPQEWFGEDIWQEKADERK
ncbi:MAG: recombinase family protein [Lachnospiraceae bacterium]|nr:recombinase family protein [Lachnospiraceae bacterium]